MRGLSTSEHPPVTDYRLVRQATTEEQQAYRDKQDRESRASWDLRLAKAHASLPKRFAWVPDLSKTNGVFVLPDELTKRLPWLTPANVSFLWDTVRSTQNVLICGPVGCGKTTLLTIIARWYLRASEFDHPKIKAQREALAQYLLEYEPGDHTTTPCDPDAMREVWRARGLRFVTAYDLLTTNQRDVDPIAVERAQNASILLLDEVGEEMKSAERGSYLASSRSPAVTSVIKHRWNDERRFFVTTPYDPNKLDAMYEGGTFRRLVEDASCASVIDLNDDGWAGAFIKERDKTKSRNVKR